MIKQGPSIGRIAAMAIFTLSCFGILLFLWLAFGGPIPLKPEGYRFNVHIPEAATLAKEADVRLAGVNVGKVKQLSLDKRGATTKVQIEMASKYAPIPKDSRVILRQKTLLGETYVEISEGHKSAGKLKDGGTLASTHVEPTVQLDEIFSSFDRKTREGFQHWMQELARATRNGRGQDLNDAFGNLPEFATTGTKLLRVLNAQGGALRGVIRNTGEVFDAITSRDDDLRHLIVNSGNTFDALASEQRALAETFRIFPTFLDESRVTQDRLLRFSRNTDPLVRALRQPARDLGPTLRDLGRLSPDLKNLFIKLDRLRVATRTTEPKLSKVLRGLEPVLEQLHPFFQEFNPVLSFLNYHQTTVSGFLNNAASDLYSTPNGNFRSQVSVGVFDGRSFERFDTRPTWERGQSYRAPNAIHRAIALGVDESFDCTAANGHPGNFAFNKNKPMPKDDTGQPFEPLANREPPCFVVPKQIYGNSVFPYPKHGQAPLEPAPQGRAGTAPANDPHPADPLF
jgi:phospholipid/cholesterol/gamma-HCH transport system substrate-binding protein